MIRRWLVKLGITAYLATLFYGVVSHAANYREGAHTSMYFIVWDMFCGWAAYEQRMHLIAQGESGKYYELTPTPWGEYQPFSDIGRQNYDTFNSHAPAIATNCLRQTQHEPMTRLYVVEESWAKKYNLPEPIWNQRYGEPKEPFSYFRLRTIMLPNGRRVRDESSWLAFQTNLTITDNPRLMAEQRRSQPMFDVRPSQPDYATEPVGQASRNDSHASRPLGN